MNDADLFSDNLTALVAIKQATGVTVRIKTHDRIQKVARLSDTELIVTILTHEEIERKYDTYLTNQGIKLLPIRLVGTTWQMCEAFIMWGEKADFEPIRIAAFEPTSIPDYWDKRIRENMCYRPGSSKQPMESAAVTEWGMSPARMIKHWDI
jgi:hypothetical protein